MSHRPAPFGRLAAILGALTLGIAACSGAAAPASSAPGSAASPATVGASPAASAGGPSLALPSNLLPSFSTDVELEALLADEFCGQKTVKSSFRGEEFVADDEDFAALVGQLGRSPADVSVATAAVEGPECAGINLIAFRIEGADQGRYEQLFIDAQAKENGTRPSKTNVGGRDVWAFSGADGNANYLYFNGDIAFGVTAATEADAAKGLAVMP